MPTYRGGEGALLHYDVLGDPGARALIVLAGGAGRHPVYLGDLAGLDERWRLVLPHLRGVGRSPAAADPQQGSYWRQAGDLEALRAHLGLDRVVLVAHSAGTRLAMAHAVQHPDEVSEMVLITPPSAHLVPVPSDAEELLAHRRGEPAFDAAVAALAQGPDTTGQDTFDAWQRATAPAFYARWGRVEQAHAGVGRVDLAAARAFFSVDPPADLPERLRQVQAPVLVVAGAQDYATGLAPVTALAGLFPTGRAAVVQDCGHYPWVEQPAAFRQTFDPFLNHLH